MKTSSFCYNRRIFQTILFFFPDIRHRTMCLSRSTGFHWWRAEAEVHSWRACPGESLTAGSAPALRAVTEPQDMDLPWLSRFTPGVTRPHISYSMSLVEPETFSFQPQRITERFSFTMEIKGLPDQMPEHACKQQSFHWVDLAPRRQIDQ